MQHKSDTLYDRVVRRFFFNALSYNDKKNICCDGIDTMNEAIFLFIRLENLKMECADKLLTFQKNNADKFHFKAEGIVQTS